MTTDKIPPLISAQLNYLLTRCPFSIKVESMWGGSKNSNLLDRFTLVIPFCLEFIKWDVIYNAMYPLAAPDIIFGPEDENFRPYNDGVSEKFSRNVLTNWDSRDPKRLLSLMLELRDLYKEYQCKLVGEIDDDRLKFEISTILSREGIEMYKSTGLDKSEEVKFSVPLLDMDLNNIVIGSTWRHQQKIYLQVTYPVGRSYSVALAAPRLKLVSSLELKSLFSVEDFRLPAWVEGMCMAEYLPILEEMLQSQIRDAVLSIEVRRKFITVLAPFFGRPLEADSVFCRKVSFLTSSGPFTFLVHFTFPLQFPKQQPILVLQSSQHFNSHGVPIKSHNLNEYPWSPRWEASEMAERIFDFLADECLRFKKYCNDIMLQQR